MHTTQAPHEHPCPNRTHAPGSARPRRPREGGDESTKRNRTLWTLVARSPLKRGRLEHDRRTRRVIEQPLAW
jgi:hypothetical protein